MSNSNRNRYYLLASASLFILAATMWSRDAALPDSEDHDHDPEHEEFVALTTEQRDAAGIRTESVRAGYLQSTVRSHGKIILDNNHVAHVIPKLAGIVKDVNKNEGDDIEQNETLFVLESREIAEAKSAYLGALKKEQIALQLFAMEQELKDKNMTSAQDFQNALKEASSAQTELELARQKLQAIGIEEDEIAEIETTPSNLRFYAVKSPLKGTVLQRHATLGEQLSAESEAFIIADLDHLWVEVFVYPQDLSQVKKGSAIHLQTLDGKEGSAEIVYINPVIDEETRRSRAIAVLNNHEREWNPGAYVSVSIDTDRQAVPLVVPKESIQTIEGETCVFVEAENGFEIRPVQAGRCDGKLTEIFSGVTKGEKVAAANTFLLKADHLKNEAEHEH